MNTETIKLCDVVYAEGCLIEVMRDIARSDSDAAQEMREFLEGVEYDDLEEIDLDEVDFEHMVEHLQDN